MRRAELGRLLGRCTDTDVIQVSGTGWIYILLSIKGAWLNVYCLNSVLLVTIIGVQNTRAGYVEACSTKLKVSIRNDIIFLSVHHIPP